ncbi:Rid family hydrolase [Chelativorans sp. J32]|uniref:Rid family hydrolase n=1 Tax=Chelativorans sp. J32 TaxID=935840 RepID=UPI0004824FF3|nr:Rid family hydrolase [Chelativorans sp. J32]
MKNRIFSGAPSEDFAGYAKAVIDGDRVYVSGTLGQDEDGAIPEDVGAQTRNALASIASALAKADMTLANAVQVRVFITDGAYLRDVAVVLGETFRDIRPTNTLLICQIPTPGAKVEIELTASRA